MYNNPLGQSLAAARSCRGSSLGDVYEVHLLGILLLTEIAECVEPHLQKEAQLLDEVLLGPPGVPGGQLQHGVAGQRAQQGRPAPRPQQLHRGRVEGVQAALEVHAQHRLAAPRALPQPLQVLRHIMWPCAQHSMQGHGLHVAHCSRIRMAEPAFQQKMA